MIFNSFWTRIVEYVRMLWLSKGMNWLSLNKTNWNAWKMSCYIKAPIIFPHYIRSPEHEQNKMNETYFGSSSFLNLLHLIPKKTLEKKYLHWVCVIEVNIFNIEFLFEITVDGSNECYFCGLYALRVFPWIGSLIHFRAAMVFQFMSCFGFSIIDNVSCSLIDESSIFVFVSWFIFTILLG